LQASNDQKFIERLESTFKGKHPNYDKPKLKRDEFIVKHFAEDVSYHMNDFRKKNQHAMAEEVMEFILTTKNKAFLEILEKGKEEDETPSTSDSPSTRNAKQRSVTVSSTFKKQLMRLKLNLDKTTPYYVRCIKPNLQQKPNLFTDEVVGKQLAYSGKKKNFIFYSLISFIF
jgi:myosin V